jgi:sigma-B regulation protein RsbU (phosphoserine phosphatase)
VVDDNEPNRDLLARRLAREGHHVRLAADGREGLASLEAEPADLVLLDVRMPGLDGYEVLRRMKADARLRHVPVVMITAVDEVASAVRCIELGAEDYLAKPFDPTVLRARVGASLEKKRLRDEIVRHLDRLERDLQVARQVQLGMVPTEFPPPAPDRPVEVFATLQPARHVGGDLYDAFSLGPHALCTLVADVSDKGAAAALFMARTKTLVRVLATAAAVPPEPDELLRQLNAELCRDNDVQMFVTLFLAVLDWTRGELVYASAGHPPPYLVTAAGAVEALAAPRARPLGVREDSRYASARRTLRPGDTVFAFTDGVTEAADAGGALFGEARLEAVLAGLAPAAPRAVVEGVLAAVRRFAGAALPSDDIAALAVRLCP